MNIKIEDLNKVTRIVLQAAITLILILFCIVGIITFGPVGVIFAILLGVASLIGGHLLAEGIEVHYRKKALEDVIEKYK